ncbi:MAG: hypothetical protein IKA50_05780 [Clostridia bacterium]|nr:hypothetical protein [Clostridia bacterium]
MAGRIIGFICYMLCAIPFWVIAKSGKDGKDPISFWSGDTSLKGKVKDIPAYNREMAKVYTIYGWAYFVAAVGGAIHPIAGVVIMVLDLIAIIFVYRSYKRILSKYS